MTSRLLVTYVRVQPRCGASASSSVVAIGRRLCASSSTSPGVQACEEEDSLRQYVDYAAVRAQQELCFDFSDLHVSGDVVLGSMPCMAVLSQHNRQLQDQSCKVFVSDTLAMPDVTIPGDLRPLLRTLLEECPNQLYPIPQGDMERLLQETNLPAMPDHHQTVLMEVDPAYATTLAGLSRIADNTPPPPLELASPAAAAAATPSTSPSPSRLRPSSAGLDSAPWGCSSRRLCAGDSCTHGYVCATQTDTPWARPCTFPAAPAAHTAESATKSARTPVHTAA
eukprot:scpid34988/ scgid8130/ 